jgi:hypothetical protein
MTDGQHKPVPEQISRALAPPAITTDRREHLNNPARSAVHTRDPPPQLRLAALLKLRRDQHITILTP